MLSRKTLGCFLVVGVFLSIIGDSSVARAALYLNLPFELRRYFFGERTIDLDELWKELEPGYQFYYEPTAITTSDHETFEISESELLQLEKSSSVLAHEVDASPTTHQLTLNISSKQLKLLRRLINGGSDVNLNLESYSQEELREMLKEARRLKCELLVNMLKSALKDSQIVSRRLTRSASEAGRKQPESIASQPDARRQLRRATTSLERFQKKTVVLPDYVKALRAFEEWLENHDFQEVACHYYPWIATEEQFANYIERLYDSENTASRDIALALFNCFIKDGFSNGKPKDELIAELFRISTDLDRTEYKGPVTSEWTNSLLEHVDQLEDAHEELHEGGAIGHEINWKNYADAEIAQAWNYVNALHLRTMPPIRSEKGKLHMDNKLDPLGRAFNGYVKWIISEVEKEQDRNEQLIFLKRFCRLAKMMLAQGNFHGAFTIYCALKGNSYLDNLEENEKATLSQVFDMKENSAMHRKLVNRRRDEGKSYIYDSTLYGKDFESLSQECHSPDMKGATAIGKFLKQMAQDQKAAASYQKGEHPELVAFFLNLGRDA